MIRFSRGGVLFFFFFFFSRNKYVQIRFDFGLWKTVKDRRRIELYPLGVIKKRGRMILKNSCVERRGNISFLSSCDLRSKKR